MKFNKIENQLYTTIEECIVSSDNTQITVKYSIGTGDEKKGVLENYQAIISEYKYITGDEALALINAPITADDVGKAPTEIMKDRVYTHLKATNEILV